MIERKSFSVCLIESGLEVKTRSTNLLNNKVKPESSQITNKLGFG